MLPFAFVQTTANWGLLVKKTNVYLYPLQFSSFKDLFTTKYQIPIQFNSVLDQGLGSYLNFNRSSH